MNGIRIWLVALIVVAVFAAGGGYLLGQWRESAPLPPTMTSARGMAATVPETRTPVYYQDPDGKAYYSPTPKKTADGRDYKPVYDISQGPAANPVSPSAPQASDRILYYRNPMGLPDTSPVPKKDAMGMNYIPVHQNEAGDNAGVVRVSPARVQMLGVRTETVHLRDAVARSIRATGTIQFDEHRLAEVTTKVGGWIEKLDVAATGESVSAGQPLLEIYSPDLVAAEREFLVVAQMGQGGMAHGDVGLMIDAAMHRLRALDVPEGEIQRLRRSGEATRRIAVLAPANGVVTEKDAVLGMHVDPGTPLYKTADLSSVWLIAEVQEQDLGAIKPGQPTRAMFIAFPGRAFEGVVDFVYPSLSPGTRTAKVRIVVPNTELLLRSDMYATVAIEAVPTSSGASILAVPNSAIIDSGVRQVVLVAKGEGRFEPRAVRVGTRGADYTEVLSGLKDGEQVVTSANFLIDAESNLRAALQAFTAADQSGGVSK